jgi:hypothetical protein
MRLRKYEVIAYNVGRVFETNSLVEAMVMADQCARGQLRPGCGGHAYVVDNSANAMVYQTVGA